MEVISMVKYGLLGKKLGHSFSKQIHEEISDIKYDFIEKNENEVESFLKEKNFDGINVTIPYKEIVIPFLNQQDEVCKETGVCNTIVNDAGNLKGYNTDYIGLCYLFDVHHIDVKQKNVLILGNGATSKTIRYFLQKRNAKKISVLGRNKKNNADLYENYQHYLDAEIIINATPVGMYPHIDEKLLSLEKFNHLQVAVDVVYNPLKTKFLIEAEDRKIQAVNGLDMLVAQAVFSNYFFLKRQQSVKIIELEVKKLCYHYTNFVLIGMPGSGKTTIGKMLASRLQRPFIDLDEEIEKTAQMSISEMFSQYGEDYFRNLEKETIKKIASQQNAVIATGGGCVLDVENIQHLRQNGFIIYLSRDLKKIKINQNRPLLKNTEQLYSLYEKRWELYEKSCNMKIENNYTLNEVVSEIEEKFYEIINCERA